METNGKNLEKIHINGKSKNNDIHMAISNSCSGLKKYLFYGKKLSILKTIFNRCQQLVSIEIWCEKRFLSEREALELVANHSPKNFMN